MPVRVEPPVQLERETLAAAIGVLKVATDEAARAGEPVTRLEQTAGRVVEIDAALKSLR